MSGKTIKARHHVFHVNQAFFGRIIELVQNDAELHDAAVRMLNAYTNLRIAQTERIKELIKKGDL